MAEKHSCRWRRTTDKQAEQLRAQQAELEASEAERVRLAAQVADLEHRLGDGGVDFRGDDGPLRVTKTSLYGSV